MNRICLFLALLLLLAGTTTAQNIDTLRRHDPGGWDFVQVVRGKSVFIEGTTHKGLREGLWTEFWETKVPHTITSYRGGKKNGSYIEIRRTGQVEFAQNYLNDKFEGPSRTYRPGAGIMEEVYYSDGQRSGTYTKWYANNVPQETGNYNHDVRDGKTVYFKENGQRLAEYTYDQGKLDGDATLYGDSGNVIEAGRYDNDTQTGVWREYHPNGKLKAEGKYKDGEKDGVWKQYDDTGKELAPITYKAGKEKK